VRESELRENADCSKCGQAIGATGVPLFYQVKLTIFGLDLRALQRQQGLAMQIGAPMASVMGPDEHLAKECASETITLCQICAIEIQGFFESCEGTTNDNSNA
jgi:hypothetical protein